MIIKRLLGLGFLAYGAIALYLFFAADSMIFLPPAASYEHDPKTDSTAVTLQSSDGNAIAARHLNSPNSRYTLLFSHGNASDIGTVMPILEPLHESGLSVFAYDYPGYGHSTGKPSEKGAYKAIDTAYAYLTEELGITPQSIIVFGQSVGGGPSTYLAEKQPVGGLILEKTFSSILDVVSPYRVLPFDKFPNIRRIAHINCPLLLIHGTSDNTIPFSHSEALLAAAKAPKQLVTIPGADHNDILMVDAKAYFEAIAQFVANLP